MSPDDQKEIDALIASLSESSGPEDIANKLLHIQRIVGEDRLTATLSTHGISEVVGIEAEAFRRRITWREQHQTRKAAYPMPPLSLQLLLSICLINHSA